VWRWVLAAALLGIALAWARRYGDPEPFRRLLAVPLPLIAAITGLTLLNQALFSARFALALEQCGAPKLRQWTWFRLTSVGQFLNLFVPQLGNVYRAYVLKRDYRIPYSLYGSGLFAFVWLDLVMGIVLAMGVIAVFEPEFRLGVFPALPVLSLLGFGLFMAPFVAVRLLRWRAFGVRGSGQRLAQRAADVLALAGNAARKPRFLLQAFALNWVMAAVQVATIGLAFHSVGAHISFGKLMLFQILVKLSNQVVVTPGNLGLTELAYGMLAEAASNGIEHGIAVGLLTRTVGVAVVCATGLLLGGGAWLLRGRRQTLAAAESEGAAPPVSGSPPR
jgi:uncharacterized membrane protein YbhN (UPF0104 family)